MENDIISKNREAIFSVTHFDYTGSLINALDSQVNINSPFSISWDLTRINDNLIPIVKYQDSLFNLNSRYDPVREAHRIAMEMESADLLILIGFEGGYLADALQKCYPKGCGFLRVLCLELIPELVVQTFFHRDLSQLIIDDRFYTAIGTTETEIRAIISQIYQVHYFRNVRIFANPAIRALYDAANLSVEKWVESSIRDMQSDFLTQAHLGRRWIHNIMCNLSMLNKKSQVTLPYAPEIIVLGAGSSVENYLSEIQLLKKNGALLFASDASLAWCQIHNLEPDVLLSIDGQSISYLHLLEGKTGTDKEVSLQVIDLCSHPQYLRECNKSLILGSSHPFIQLLKQLGLHCGDIDTSGGNVGQSLVGLSLAVRAKRVHVFGLDFAYILGKPYLRPAFFYSSLFKDSNRLNSVEHQIIQLWIGQELVPLNDTPEYYRTPRMQWYFDSFKALVADSSAEIISYNKNYVVNTATNNVVNHNLTTVSPSPAHFNSEIKISNVMYQIDECLKELEYSIKSPLELRDGPEGLQKNIMLALLPLIAWYTAFILKTDPENTDISKSALHKAAIETRNLIAHFFR